MFLTISLVFCEHEPFMTANKKEIPDFGDSRYDGVCSTFRFPRFRSRFLYILLVYRSGTSSRCTRKPRIRVDYDGARISLSHKSVPRSICYTLLRSTANSILVNIVFIEQLYKIRITVWAWKHLAFLSWKTLRSPFAHGIYSAAHAFLFICHHACSIADKIAKISYCYYFNSNKLFTT